MNKQNIITRFAPSPTGDPHIGSLRNALYAWLFARQHGGKFLLRIDDTDRSRYQEGSDQAIFEMLEWAGLDFDETWHQSTRLETHQKYAEQLVGQGKAYKCFCTLERLEGMRKKQQANKQAPRYDQACRRLSEDEVSQRQARGDKFVIRLAIPESGETRVADIVRGEVAFQNSELDDFVILKSDGYPTYHLASVVDDNEYGVTHVIRSEEWFPSLPKHVLIYRGLSWDLPQFAHLPLILAPDKSKLSKRHGATGVLEFKKLGYLPDALVNFVLLLGWHPKQGSEQEIFTREEMKKAFSLQDVQKGGAVFDYHKLDWVNAEYIKHYEGDLFELAEQAGINWEDFNISAYDKDKRVSLSKLISDRLKKLADIPQALSFIKYNESFPAEILVWKKGDKAEAVSRLESALEFLNVVAENNWNADYLEEYVKEKIEKDDLGIGNTLWPLRVSLSGQEKSPGPFEMAEALGKAETIRRIKLALNKLKK